MGEVFDVEHALVVDGHFLGQPSVRETIEIGGIEVIPPSFRRP
jgi:hypothetical protein